MSTQATITKFELPTIPDQQKADKLIKPLLSQALGFKIKDEDDYLASGVLIERHDAVIKQLTDGDEEKKFIGFKAFVAGLHGMHKMALALMNQFVGPLERSKDSLLDERQRYRDEQARLNQEKADRDAEILRKQQAKELMQEAKKHEKVGDVETATVLREQAKTMPAPVVPVAAAAPKQSGFVERPVWEMTVTNYELVPIEYKTLDYTKKGERELIDSKIRAVTSKLGNAIKIPGVEVRSTTSEHSRAVR